MMVYPNHSANVMDIPTVDSIRPKTTTLMGVPEGSKQPPNMTAKGIAIEMQRPNFDSPGTAP